MPARIFPYTRDDVLSRAENLVLLLSAAKGVRGCLAEARRIGRITKNPNLLRLGATLLLLPEPVTTVVGLPIVAYSLSQNNTLKLGEELARSYNELWESLSWL